MEGAADVAAGLGLLAGGAVTWVRARQSRTGPLLTLAGVTWLAGDVMGALVYLHRGPLVQVLLTFPSGRTRSRRVIALVAVAYVDGVVPSVARSPWVTVALLALVASTSLWRWRTGPWAERRARLLAAGCALVLTAPLALVAVGRLSGHDLYDVASWMFEAGVALTAVVLAGELLSARSTSAATGLIVDLADQQEPRALRDAVARAIGDLSLQIAFRVDRGWVDEYGQPTLLPVVGGMEERTVTLVEDAGAPVAALVHDPTALRDTSLAESVAAAVRLVLANVRLQAAAVADLGELTASRRRLVEAGDDQRRRLREQLRSGAERILSEVSSDLTALSRSPTRETEVTGQLLELVRALDAARQDLDRFALGVHPKALTEQGLQGSLRDLAGQAAVPVSLEVSSRRFPEEHEAAVFFVCSEALANVAKYADASAVSIEVGVTGSRLVVRIVDDGRGGADPASGSGLRGLRDRIEALGGRFVLRSPRGAGTRLEAALPLAAEAP